MSLFDFSILGLEFVLTLLLGAFLFSIVYIFYQRSERRCPGSSSDPISTLVVLGSGGHTREMMAMISALDAEKYSPMWFVAADTDPLSMEKAKQFDAECEIVQIPRSREVKQSLITTAWTTAKSSLFCYRLLLSRPVDLLLCNGPGTCVPLCLAAWINNRLGISKTKIIFVESICRVKSLSLSGTILSYFVSDILVQWPELAQKYPKTKYIARFV